MPIYLGTFLIAFATLALQIAVTRLLSISTWYHIAFFAIATGMLGMTIGAVRVYCAPERFAEKNLLKNLIHGSVFFALSTPLALFILCFIPLKISIFSVMEMIALLLITSACILPYYFAGIVVTLVLTRCKLPVGRVYAADLLGASLGCLFVLVAMNILDPASMVLACAGLGALSACGFALGQGLKPASLCALLGLLLLAGGLLNTRSMDFIRPLMVKGRMKPANTYAFERYNSFSQINGEPKHKTDSPMLWGGSSKVPKYETESFRMVIDGQAGTTARRFHTLADIEHLRYDVTNAAYHLRPQGGACIIGVGGGRDVQSAVLFGHEDVLGVDVNPIFIDLIENEFRDFIGLADRPEVRLKVDDARSYLSRSDEEFSVLQMSLIDTWAATGAGAYSLSENALYTVEAWDVFLNRLKPDGIFTVSRWYDPEGLGELGRLLSLAIASQLERGVEQPQDTIAIVASDHIATLLVSAQPFSAEDIQSLKEYCKEYDFLTVMLPGALPEHPILKRLAEARTLADLETVPENDYLRLEPPTDESPYFFNMLSFSSLLKSPANLKAGVVHGNVLASQTLLTLIAVLTIATFCTVLVPLWLRPLLVREELNSTSLLWSGAIYFSLIGAGFMLVEIALIQRLSVLLGHPTYALGILLFTLILSTGVGSFLSERLPLIRAPWVFFYPLLPAVMILITSEAVRYVTGHMITASLPVKIATSIAVIFPLGISLGLCFPTGMRLVKAARPGETPWYWALNGVFGVLCSAVAVAISIFTWISLNFYLAAICYALVALAARRIYYHVQNNPPESGNLNEAIDG